MRLVKETETTVALPGLRAVGSNFAGRVAVLRVLVEECRPGFFHLLEDKTSHYFLLLERKKMEYYNTMEYRPDWVRAMT